MALRLAETMAEDQAPKSNGWAALHDAVTHADLSKLPGEAAPAEGFTSAQVCAMAGLTYRQLDYWSRREHVARKVQGRSGWARRWTRDEAALVVIAAHLLRAGLAVESAAEVARTAYAAGLVWIARGEGVALLVDVSRILTAAGL